MLKQLIVIISLAICFAMLSTARAAEEKKPATRDSKFLMSAITGGELEVALGKIAATKGATSDVKAFGQMMADDHTKANDEVKELAKSKGVDIKKAEDSAIKKESKEETSLAKKEGSDFDKAYMKMMVEDHEKDVKAFEKASKECEDADVKAWAAKTLPTLQGHLEKAKEVQGKIGK